MGSEIDFDGIVRQREELERMMATNPETEKRIRDIVRAVLKKARAGLSDAARRYMDSDPRQAYKAVRMAVYRRMLGGNVNILQRRRAGQGGRYEPPRTGRQGQVGGNRRRRSPRTEAMQGYAGADRGFVLRFLNAGTAERYVDFRADERRGRINYGARGGRMPESVNTGRRGRIAPRNWFGNAARRETERAATELERMIAEMVAREFYRKK